MTDATERATDLGALLGRLHAAVIEREGPILRKHGLTMWEYVILAGLRDEAGVSQTALARVTRRDPTRLSMQVNELNGRGFLARYSDQSDRRRNVVTLTARGRTLLTAIEVDIRAMEAEMLEMLSPDSQRELRHLLALAAERLQTK